MNDRNESVSIIASRAIVPAPRAQVAELFWDICAWHTIWTRIDDVEVHYDDRVHQEFTMGVQRDGHREDVRTIRYRRDDGDIDFFSPRPPPTMSVHTGRWEFRADPASHARCAVTARREYRLIRASDESHAAYRQRRQEYAEGLTQRLASILDCFIAHYERHRTQDLEAGMTTCTESIHIDHSPERVGAFLQDVHNLPRWTGFFRSVGRPIGDRWEVNTAIGTTMRTRIERAATDRYAISSLIGEREERAEIMVLPEEAGTRVSFTVKVLPELLAEHPGDEGVAVQHDRMRGELLRLCRAVTRTEVSAP